MSGIGLRIRDQEGRPQQPDRPRGRRRASAAAVALARRSAGSWSWSSCSRRGSTSSCCSTATRSSRCRSERAAEEEINRHLRLEIETLRAPGGSSGSRRELAPGRAVKRRGHRDPAGDAVGAPGKVHRRGAVASAGVRRPWRTIRGGDSDSLDRAGAARRAAGDGRVAD